MGVLPQISGQRLCNVFEKLGYSAISQRGSHIKLKLNSKKGIHTIIIPWMACLLFDNYKNITRYFSFHVKKQSAHFG